MTNTTAIARLYVEYSRFWFGKCDQATADRMMEIERLVAAAIPTSLSDAMMQQSVGVCGEDGHIEDGKLLAQPPHFEAAVQDTRATAIARAYWRWHELNLPGRTACDLGPEEGDLVCAEINGLETTLVDTPSMNAADLRMKVQFCQVQNEDGYDIESILKSIDRDVARLGAVMPICEAA